MLFAMRLSRFTLPTILSLVAISLCPGVSRATTYSGGGGVIADVTTNTFEINVDDNELISNFYNITFTGEHTYIGDLIFTLSHLDTGTSVIFVDSVPSGSDLNGTYSFVTDLASQVDSPDSFWQAAANASGGEEGGSDPIASGTYAAANTNPNGGGEGSYTPTTFDVFNGENVNGTWRLTIKDQAEGDTGNLDKWSFAVGSAVVPEASSLALALPALGLVGGVALRRCKK